jgi:hypothetical protein
MVRTCQPAWRRGEYLQVVRQTVLATPEEYADLKCELEAEPYKYQLRVCEHRTTEHIEEYREALHTWLLRNQEK